MAPRPRASALDPRPARDDRAQHSLPLDRHVQRLTQPAPPSASARISRIRTWRRSSPATSGPAPPGSPSRQRSSTSTTSAAAGCRPRGPRRSGGAVRGRRRSSVRPLPQRRPRPLGGRVAEHLPYERGGFVVDGRRSPWSLWPPRGVPTSPPRRPPGRPTADAARRPRTRATAEQRSRQARPLAARPRSSACAISSLRLFDATGRLPSRTQYFLLLCPVARLRTPPGRKCPSPPTIGSRIPRR